MGATVRTEFNAAGFVGAKLKASNARNAAANARTLIEIFLDPQVKQNSSRYGAVVAAAHARLMELAAANASANEIISDFYAFQLVHGHRGIRGELVEAGCVQLGTMAMGGRFAIDGLFEQLRNANGRETAKELLKRIMQENPVEVSVALKAMGGKVRGEREAQAAMREVRIQLSACMPARENMLIVALRRVRILPATGNGVPAQPKKNSIPR